MIQAPNRGILEVESGTTIGFKTRLHRLTPEELSGKKVCFCIMKIVMDNKLDAISMKNDSRERHLFCTYEIETTLTQELKWTVNNDDHR